MKNSIVISFKGQSPEQLGGFNYHHPINLATASKINKRLFHYLEQGKSIHAISGLDLGADQIFALTALKLKKQGYSITLEAVIPCNNQMEIWPEEFKKLWHEIVEKADQVTYTSRDAHTLQLMHKRNMYLVDRCDEIIAVFNGKRSGTANTVRYAKRRNKPIFLIDPRGLVIPVKGNLLTSDCDIMMHQANCFSTMDSGIAKRIKEMYPHVYEADLQSLLTPEMKLGTYTRAEIQTPHKLGEFVNLYGQFEYGYDKQHTNYQALYSAIFEYLEEKRSVLGNISHLKIGVPNNMGCDRGGGDWNEVLSILHDAAEHFKVHIYTYTL